MLLRAAPATATATVLSERGARPEIVRQRIRDSVNCRRTVRLQRCPVVRELGRGQQTTLLVGARGKRKATAPTAAERRQDSGTPIARRTDRRGRHSPTAPTDRRGRARRSPARRPHPMAIVRTRRRSAAPRRLTTIAGIPRSSHEGTRLRGRIPHQAAATRRHRVRTRRRAAATLRRHARTRRRATALVAEAALAAVEVEARMAEVPALTADHNFQTNRAPAPQLGAGVFMPSSQEILQLSIFSFSLARRFTRFRRSARLGLPSHTTLPVRRC
jgi:hypothetical protein